MIKFILIAVIVFCGILFSILVYFIKKGIFMKIKMYIIDENPETGEKHIFIVYKQVYGKYKKESKSICGKVTNNSPISDKEKKLVTNENDTRLKCAKIGREICGTCVSHLYANYK